MQISSGNTKDNVFLVIFAGRALKLEEAGQIVFTFQSMLNLVMRCRRQQEAVSMSKSSLNKKKKLIIIFWN